MNPKAIGEISEGVVLAHMIKRGVPVLIPFGNNQRYDMVIEEEGELIRAQVKTGRLADGCVIFKTSSVNGFTGKRTMYVGSADIFLVYCPETEQVYRVPVEECGVSRASLRVAPGRSRPTTKRAEDYVIP